MQSCIKEGDNAKRKFKREKDRKRGKERNKRLKTKMRNIGELARGERIPNCGRGQG